MVQRQKGLSLLQSHPTLQAGTGRAFHQRTWALLFTFFNAYFFLIILFLMHVYLGSSSYIYSSSPTLCNTETPPIDDHGDGFQDGDYGHERHRRVPELVHGAEVEEGAQIHRVQDRRAIQDRHGRQGRRTSGELRRSRRFPPRRRLPVRRLRFRFCHGRQLPEEQDLLHRVGSECFQDQSKDAVCDVEAWVAESSGWSSL